MNRWIALLVCVIACAKSTLATAENQKPTTKQPNFVIIFADDQGYNDMSCFGAKKLKTPHLDQMAAEGTRFTSFYSAASVCTPSRAALLTGCYPGRVGKLPVPFPRSSIGIHPDEETIAEILKATGYRTACFGKWHLGHHQTFLPMQNGFDEYFGVPYSNDMGIDTSMKLSKNVKWNEGANEEKFRAGGTRLPPLMEGNEVVEWPADQRTLTQRYTQRAKQFIQKCAKSQKPFFLYLPHTMPHIPLYVTDKYRGRSDSGLYGDSIEEIDAGVGNILQTIKDTGIANNTIVVYTSDNGPWNLKGNATDKVKGNLNRRTGGSAFPLRGYKFSRWEGGMRVPTIFWGPGLVQKGSVSSEIAGTIDLLPTFAALAGANLPKKKIDGKNITKLLSDESAISPHAAYFYRTEAVRQGQWKLKGNQLFDLDKDISETTDVSKQHPDIVSRLRKLLEDHKKELANQGRAPGQVTLPPQPVGGMKGWTRINGNWNFKNQKSLHQNNQRGETLVLGPATENESYSFVCNARVKKGSEGFRMVVGAANPKNYVRWSCGAYGNTLHSLMVVKNGVVSKRSEPFKTELVAGKWHQLKITVSSNTIQCFVDDKLTNTLKVEDLPGNRVGLGSNLASVEFKNAKIILPNEQKILF